jgi:enoyl-CoA hydratase
MIRLEINGNVGELILDRPKKLNTMTPDMFKQLRDVCNEINDNDDIHTVLFYGAGDKAFCAGTDINTLKDYKDFWAWRNRIDYVTQIRSIRKVVVCVTKGWALGGGHELAVAADIRIAAKSTVFGSPEVALGWVGAGGTSQFLPKLIGYGQTMKLLATGDRIDADEALRIGLVEEVVDGDVEALERGRAMAQQIASYPVVATISTKAAVRASMFGSLEAGLQIENELMTLCFAKGQAAEGAEKFNSRK